MCGKADGSEKKTIRVRSMLVPATHNKPVTSVVYERFVSSIQHQDPFIPISSVGGGFNGTDFGRFEISDITFQHIIFALKCYE